LDHDVDTAHYTSGDKNEYFGWKDSKTDTARELAAKFIKQFPGIAQKGLGEDWAYVGWYVQMLGLAERGEFPVAYADWYTTQIRGGCLPQRDSRADCQCRRLGRHEASRAGSSNLPQALLLCT
jgi:hypothetical protein